MRGSISVRLFGEWSEIKISEVTKGPCQPRRPFWSTEHSAGTKARKVRPLPQGLRSGPAALLRFEGPSLSFKQLLLHKGQGRVVGFARGGGPGASFLVGAVVGKFPLLRPVPPRLPRPQTCLSSGTNCPLGLGGTDKEAGGGEGGRGCTPQISAVDIHPGAPGHLPEPGRKVHRRKVNTAICH